MTTAVTIAMMKINNCNLKGNRDQLAITDNKCQSLLSKCHYLDDDSTSRDLI